MPTRVYTDGARRHGLAGWAWYVSPTRFASGPLGAEVSVAASEAGAILEAVASASPDEDLLVLSDSEQAITLVLSPGPAGWRRADGTARRDTEAHVVAIARAVRALLASRAGAVAFEHINGHGRATTVEDVAGNAAADWLAGQATTPTQVIPAWATPPVRAGRPRHSPTNPPLT